MTHRWAGRVRVTARRLGTSHFGRASRVDKRTVELPDPGFRVVLALNAQMLPYRDRAE
jgi:hypothetical protein